MGATFVEHNDDGLPLSVTGGPLRPLTHCLQVSSAQVKGALLFAGLAAGVSVDLVEPSGRSRDHTEPHGRDRSGVDPFPSHRSGSPV
jgi:3-phosphoshikimate 1-carboxyvinyltransferase